MRFDPYFGPRFKLREILLWFGIGLVVAYIVTFYAMITDWRWILAFPVLFLVTWLWIKLWALVEGIDRDGLTPKDRARRDREDGDWNA